jgi:hypothetical protein
MSSPTSGWSSTIITPLIAMSAPNVAGDSPWARRSMGNPMKDWKNTRNRPSVNAQTAANRRSRAIVPIMAARVTFADAERARCVSGRATHSTMPKSAVVIASAMKSTR